MSDALPEIDDYRRLFLDDVPLLDVRAPVEFAQGAFPHAENHPLINDAERHEIGILYKDLGHDAAVEHGHELVNGEVKAARIAAWQRFAEQHPEGVLYCFRGGQRSRISQQWLSEASGRPYPRVKGGYKALRRFLIDELEVSAREIDPLVIGGRTGVGKTLLLKRLDNAVDLEGLAWHRGSAFGRHATPQPTQIDFENRLSIALLKQRAAGRAPLLFEDEGRNIGSLGIPPVLRDRLGSAPLLLLEADIDTRVGYTREEYVDEALAEYQALAGDEQGFEDWAQYLLDSLDRIRKRLGGERHQALRNVMQAAIDEQRRSGDTGAHDSWIRSLLLDYYDPMYDYQIANKRERIVVSGEAEQIIEWLKDYSTRA